jgi:hypothetical protein
MYPNIETDIELEPEAYVVKLKNDLLKTFEVVKTHCDYQIERQRILHDRRIHKKEFEIGERVMLRDGQRKKGKSKKLQFKWKGPYTVIQHQIINDEFGHQIKNYVVKPDIGSKTKLVHASRLKTTIVPRRTLERNITEITNEVFDAVLNPTEQSNILQMRKEETQLLTMPIRLTKRAAKEP